MASGFKGIQVGHSVGMLFFWVTPATCVSSIFLFAFGVSMLSYFLTGNESVSIWEVLKLMESLPDPREFLSDTLKVYNVMMNVASKIQLNVNASANNNDFFKFVTEGLNTIIYFMSAIIGFAGSMIYGFVLFPIYIVFFTLRTIGSFLTVLGVGNMQQYTSMSWKILGWLGI